MLFEGNLKESLTLRIAGISGRSLSLLFCRVFPLGLVGYVQRVVVDSLFRQGLSKELLQDAVLPGVVSQKCLLVFPGEL